MAGNKNSGNRTNHKPNTGNSELAARSRAKSEELAEARRGTALKQYRRWTAERIADGLGLVFDYMNKCIDSGEPVTVAGCILAGGFTRDIWDRVKRGECDHLQDLDEQNCEQNRDAMIIPFSQQVEKCYLTIEAQTERRLYESGKVGDIFALKSLHGWRDGSEQTTPHTVNQTLVIADSEQARAAIGLLK